MTKKKDPSQLKPRGRKPAAKSTAIEVQSRVNKVFDLLIQGATRAQIIQYASGQPPKIQDDGTMSAGRPEWGVGERMIDEYIAKANALFSEQSIVDRKREVGKALSRLNFLYTANIKAGDLKAALDTEKAKAALLGLNAPTKLAHEGKDGSPIQVDTKINVTEEVKKLAGILPVVKP